MIKLFDTNDTAFELSNGDKIIIPLKAVIYKKDNGDFYLDLETDLSYSDDLIPTRLLVTEVPNLGPQAFRIGTIEKTQYKIKLKAKHVYYDGDNYLIKSKYIFKQTCNQALETINTSTDNPSVFTTTSNIEEVHNYRCIRKSLSEATLLIAERWGGHLIRNNWNIEIRETIGQDNGVTIRYGKNEKDIQATYNWDKVVTKLLPVGKDELMLPEEYVYSSRQYDLPYTKKVNFSQDIDENSYKDKDGNWEDEAQYRWDLMDDLRDQAEKYVNKYSLPQVNYTIKANIEKVTDVGDTIEVIDERLGINVMTHVISYKYDCITKRYIEIEFGNFEQRLDNLLTTITEQTTDAITESDGILKVTLSDELKTATNRLWDALNASEVIIEENKILIVDKLPKEEATNVILIDSEGLGFSTTGINGTFNTAFTIDGKLLTQNVEVLNFTADIIKGGALKLGANENANGYIEVYDTANFLVAEINSAGIKINAKNGDYVLLNAEEGFAGYNASGVKVYWADGEEFHMKRSVVDNEATWFSKIKMVPMTIVEVNGNTETITNDGVAFVAI